MEDLCLVVHWSPDSGMCSGAEESAASLLSILHLLGGRAATVEHLPLIAPEHPSGVRELIYGCNLKNYSKDSHYIEFENPELKEKTLSQREDSLSSEMVYMVSFTHGLCVRWCCV